MAIRTISLEDIRSVPEAHKVLLSGDETLFKELLFSIGFDVERDIEMEVVTHRPMVHQKEITGPRWIGHERRDDEWMKSKHCTQENRLEKVGTTDLAFQRELVAMGSLPNYTAMIISHIKGAEGKQKQKAGAK